MRKTIQSRVFDYLKTHKATRLEVAEALLIDPKQANTAISHLMVVGKIIEVGKRNGGTIYTLYDPEKVDVPLNLAPAPYARGYRWWNGAGKLY